MPKNIVVCLDGTGNEFSKRNLTNVVRLFRAIERQSDQQIAYYDPGVGTFGKKLAGKAFGVGITQNIQEAYAYLMNNFVEGDRVFLFGFSRGAFTARSLSGMLYRCGLLPRRSENLISYASNLYQTGDDETAARFKRTFARECKPLVLGLWDTVGSLWRYTTKRFQSDAMSPDVRYGFHALSIDERRSKFPPSLWDESKIQPGQTIEQVWFAGVHSDVGGWYQERGLSNVALRWMLAKAVDPSGDGSSPGLRLDEGYDPGDDVPNPLDEIHESYTGGWKLLGAERRDVPEGSLVHESVVARSHDASASYAPQNLPASFRSVQTPPLAPSSEWRRVDAGTPPITPP